HAAFASARKLHFPLLADFEPKGAVSRAYGAYRPEDGHSERALFVIDGDGIIRWSYCSPVGVNPGADGILDALEAMESPQGPGALHAAEAAESVAAQAGADAYWAMHHAIFEHQQDSADALDDAHLARYAAAVGADAAQVTQDLADEKYVDKVKADFMSGVRSG